MPQEQQTAFDDSKYLGSGDVSVKAIVGDLRKAYGIPKDKSDREVFRSFYKHAKQANPKWGDVGFVDDIAPETKAPGAPPPIPAEAAKPAAPPQAPPAATPAAKPKPNGSIPSPEFNPVGQSDTLKGQEADIGQRASQPFNPVYGKGMKERLTEKFDQDKGNKSLYRQISDPIQEEMAGFIDAIASPVGIVTAGVGPGLRAGEEAGAAALPWLKQKAMNALKFADKAVRGGYAVKQLVGGATEFLKNPTPEGASRFLTQALIAGYVSKPEIKQVAGKIRGTPKPAPAARGSAAPPVSPEDVTAALSGDAGKPKAPPQAPAAATPEDVTAALSGEKAPPAEGPVSRVRAKTAKNNAIREATKSPAEKAALADVQRKTKQLAADKEVAGELTEEALQKKATKKVPPKELKRTKEAVDKNTRQLAKDFLENGESEDWVRKMLKVNHGLSEEEALSLIEDIGVPKKAEVKPEAPAPKKETPAKPAAAKPAPKKAAAPPATPAGKPENVTQKLTQPGGTPAETKAKADKVAPVVEARQQVIDYIQEKLRRGKVEPMDADQLKALVGNTHPEVGRRAKKQFNKEPGVIMERDGQEGIAFKHEGKTYFAPILDPDNPIPITETVGKAEVPVEWMSKEKGKKAPPKEPEAPAEQPKEDGSDSEDFGLPPVGRVVSNYVLDNLADKGEAAFPATITLEDSAGKPLQKIEVKNQAEVDKLRKTLPSDVLRNATKFKKIKFQMAGTAGKGERPVEAFAADIKKDQALTPEQRAAAAKVRIKQATRRGSFSFKPDDGSGLTKDVMDFAKSIRGKISDFKEWSRAMVRELGSQISKHLESVWGAIQ